VRTILTAPSRNNLTYLLCVAVKDNSRYESLQFDIDLDTVLHGFGGYFYCVLYGDVAFSTSHKLVVLSSSYYCLVLSTDCLLQKLADMFVAVG